MLRKDLLFLLSSLSLCSLLFVGSAVAQEDDELDELDELDDEEGLEDEDEFDPDSDNSEVYADYKEELEGESPSEELEGWERYLEAYPSSQFRMEIEQRMKALEDAAFDELQGDDNLDDEPAPDVDA